MGFSQLFCISSYDIAKEITRFFDFFLSNDYENIKRLIAAIVVFFIFSLMRKLFTKYILSLIKKLFSKIKIFSNMRLMACFEKPVNILFIIFGVYIALSILGKNYLINMQFMTKILRSIFVILISWGFYNLSGEVSSIPDGVKEKFGLKVDKILFPFISKCLKVIVIALSVTIVLSEWNINVQMFITGLGLGGLAFSLAAKDAASNVIAGIILILEKPFNIGDWIATNNIEGVVEDISFRSTKVRTFTQEVVIIPNSNITNGSIINYARRNKRKCNFTVGIGYDTTKEKMKNAISRIIEVLKANDKILKNDVIVNFEKFNDSSLDIAIYYYTNITDFRTFSKVREEINFNILDILKEEGIEIPYPTSDINIKTSTAYKDVIEEDIIKEEFSNKNIG